MDIIPCEPKNQKEEDLRLAERTSLPMSSFALNFAPATAFVKEPNTLGLKRSIVIFESTGMWLRDGHMMSGQ